MENRDLQAFVGEADGGSVTVPRLTGKAMYFADCLSVLEPAEQPHHLLCLTTSNTGHGNAIIEVEDTIKQHSQSEAASILFTDTHIRVIYGGGILPHEVGDESINVEKFLPSNISISYNEVDDIERFEGPAISIYSGYRSYHFEIARHAVNEFEVADAVGFVKEHLKQQSNDDLEVETELVNRLKCLAYLRESGTLSEEEYGVLKERVMK